MIEFPTPEEQDLHQMLVNQANRATVPDDLAGRISATATPSPLRSQTSRMLFSAACLVLVTAFGAWFISESNNDAPPAGSPTTVPAAGPTETFGPVGTTQNPCVASSLEELEVIVWMLVTATPEQIAVVDNHLKISTTVESFTYVDQEETYAEFEDFWTGSPEVLASVQPHDLPTSFRVQLGDIELMSPALAAREFDRLEGVFKTDHPGIADGVMALFIENGATQEQIDLTEDYLAKDEAVDAFRYYEQAGSFNMFSRFLGGEVSPEVLDAIRPANLPTSFSVEVVAGTQSGELASSFLGLPGVLTGNFNGRDGEMTLFTDGQIAKAEVDHNARLLGMDERVLAFEYRDRAATYGEFAEMVAGGISQELLEAIEPEGLPTMFRLELTPESHPAGLKPFLSTLPGVLVADWNPTC